MGETSSVSVSGVAGSVQAKQQGSRPGEGEEEEEEEGLLQSSDRWMLLLLRWKEGD